MKTAFHALRFGSDVVTLALAAAAAVIGLIAFADFGDRGCFSSDATQCGDAQTMMLAAFGLAVVGAILWFSIIFISKRPSSVLMQEAAK